jgi:uncharacterized membrane protein YtjA (UPF0391 family)
MLIRVSKILFLLALALCICNSVMGTYSTLTSAGAFHLGKLIQYYVPTLLLLVFYFTSMRKKTTQ